MADEADLDPDLPPLELGHAGDPGPRDHHVTTTATPGAPLLPVTSAPPLVTHAASTLPAEQASIEGTYSNQARDP
ncbi:hypothetical protein [Sorangium sp. So ce1099]|uniref:hypothetical protein n=1 Tax=Sorangium sp. So ce1099 TaxID=3133331 RepID=UPI003F5E97B7